jgi:tRNA A37 methylthiotransferase MiaB
LIERVKPDVVNVSKFFARPGTLAAKMQSDFVAVSEVKRRSVAAAKLAGKVALERNQRWIGWKGDVFVDEVGTVSGSWVGRNFAYKPITVSSAKDVFGKILRVKVARAFSTRLDGEVMNKLV